MDKNANEFSIEAALARIEEITRILDANTTSLDDSMKLYEEGIILVRKCSVKLGDTERKITELRTNAQGDTVGIPIEYNGD